MKTANHKWRRYLFLLPVLVLILNAIYFKFITDEIKRALLGEKYTEIVNAVDMLGAAAEADADRLWLNHKDSIRDSVEFLDGLYQIYAALYMCADEQIFLVSDRVYETSPFEPLEYSYFREAVSSRESGSVVIGYAPDGQTHRDMHIYFKWLPLYLPSGERYFVAAGVSSYSVVTSISVWVSAGQWASMAVTFALNVWLILMLSRIGSVDDEIDGKTDQSSRRGESCDGR